MCDCSGKEGVFIVILALWGVSFLRRLSIRLVDI